MNGWILILSGLVVVVAVLVISSLATRRRRRSAETARDAEMDSLREIYTTGGWHRPAERLLPNERIMTERSAGWSAREGVARYYLPTGLRPTHRDGGEDGDESASPS